MSEYVYLWRFRSAPGKRGEFVAAYGAGGAWESLFRKASGFLETKLLQSRADPDVFVTVDRWESHEAFLEFKRCFAAEYAAVDSECERLTAGEEEIGTFDALT